MLKLNKASSFHLGGAKQIQTEQAHWLRRAAVAKGAHRWRCLLTSGWGGGGASRSSDGERTGNLDSQIPKESVSLCQDKGHLARFYSKGRVTSNKLLPRGFKYIRDCPEKVARVEPCKSPGGTQFLWLKSENEGV